MSHVVIRESGGYSPNALQTYFGLGSVYNSEFDDQVFFKELQEAEILVIRLKKITSDLIDRAPRLKIIACPTTGLDHIDLAKTEERGIKIVSLKGRRDITEKIYATSEHTVGLILALMRHIPAAHQHVLEGGWNRDLFIGHEVSGRTVGILGCGRLGSRVASILQVMGARLITHEPYQPAEKIPSFVKTVSFEDLLKESDILSIHVNLTDETTHLLSDKEFAMMKSGAYLINTARGPIIDEQALLKALMSGTLAGAALDVMEGENERGEHLKNNALLEYAKAHDNLIFTPHIGGAARESMWLTEEAIAKEVEKVIKS